MTERTPADPPAAQRQPRGSNHAGMRAYNERVVLQAIRLHGELPKADLARLTHLSTQTVSLIVNRLLDDGLVVKREPLRGRIGQPSVPIALNPEGAWSIGVTIGRQRLDLLLMDFVGTVRERDAWHYDFPDPDLLFDELGRRVAALSRRLGPEGAARLTGLGVAAPQSLGGWQALLGVPAQPARRWNEIDLTERLRAVSDLPVHLVKDTAAACVAELVTGRGRQHESWLYLFMDTFVGGSLVLGGHLLPGGTGNAGAVGSMPLHGVLPAPAGSPGGAPAQVLSAAALWALRRRFELAGLDPAAAQDHRALEPAWLPHTREWLRSAAAAMALAVVNGACLLDIAQVVVDGVLPRDLLARLIAEIDHALDGHNWEGVQRPAVLAGAVGPDARAMGGALLPLYAQFAPDTAVFLKPAPDPA